MIKAIKVPVLKDEDEDAQLSIDFEDDVVTFKLNGKVIFAGDWENNFKQVFSEALKSWK